MFEKDKLFNFLSRWLEVVSIIGTALKDCHLCDCGNHSYGKTHRLCFIGGLEEKEIIFEKSPIEVFPRGV